MRHLRLARTQVLTTTEQVRAVFSLPALYQLAALIPARQATGRPAQHPAWLLLGYGVLARVFRSGARVENELTDPGMWQMVLDAAERMRRTYPGLEIPPAGRASPGWDAWKYVRNQHFTHPEVLHALQAEFTRVAVEQARSLGLLDPNGPGSLTRPDRSRTVYGDGTVVRPMYKPPAAKRSTDPATGDTVIRYLGPDGQPIDAPARRFDPDAADYHGHTGSVHGQNFVAIYVRGEDPHQRIVLGAHRVERPGLEADTAVAAFRDLHAVAGQGIQAIVYDGAMRGVHIDELMTRCGVLVINKVHASAKTKARKATVGKNTVAAPRWFTLGIWEHDTLHGPCQHALAAVDGAVSEVGIDDTGTSTVLNRLTRRQVKRRRRPRHRRRRRRLHPPVRAAQRRRSVQLPLQTHPARRPRDEPRRRRQLLDVLCYGLLNNAIAAHHARIASNSTVTRLRPAIEAA